MSIFTKIKRAYTRREGLEINYKEIEILHNKFDINGFIEDEKLDRACNRLLKKNNARIIK